MRVSRCNGAVIKDNYSERMRHHYDYVMSYDCNASHNYSNNSFGNAYTTHGGHSKRISSISDTAVFGIRNNNESSAVGWTIGNSDFAEDYDVSLINFRYRGQGTGILIMSNSEHVHIINPRISAGERGIVAYAGAKNIKIHGGLITVDKNSQLFPAGLGFIGVYIRSEFASNEYDPGEYVHCRNIEIYDTTIITKNRAVLANLEGTFIMKNCTIRGDGSTSELITLNSDNIVDFPDKPFVDSVDITGNHFYGNSLNCLHLFEAPLSYSSITDNYYEDGSYTNKALVLSPDRKQVLNSTDTINPKSNFWNIQRSTPITLTSTPSIKPLGFDEGYVLTLFNSGNNDITLQDDQILNGSKLFLGGSNITLGPIESLSLIYSLIEEGWVKSS